MIIAVVSGFAVGALMLVLREILKNNSMESVWNIIHAIFFQDITITDGFKGIGLFYIIGQVFMHGLQLAIVPLVLSSLSLALCSLADPERLGKIAGKTFISYMCFYVVAAALAGGAAYLVKTLGWFDVNLPETVVTETIILEGYNPLITIVNAVPSNIISAFSTNNAILSVVVIAIILGLCMTNLGENPKPFMKKAFKIGMFAAATNSSAATLPLNTSTCIEELGCTEEISSFVLPTGMTINMNGTTAMHMIAVTFIATAAGIDLKPSTLVLAAFLSICTAVGTPAIPVAGTTMVYVVMTGLGMNTDLCMIGYSLVLAMNYLPGMAVITLNVIGDAATNVIVNFKEGVLDREKYYRE